MVVEQFITTSQKLCSDELSGAINYFLDLLLLIPFL